MTESVFTVHEAYTRDIGYGVIRIDKNTMSDLMIEAGDVVEIMNTQRAVAKCLPLYPADEGKKIIRIDGLIRNNCKTKIGNRVFLKKINTQVADSIMVLPLESIPPIDARYLADALESIPVIPSQFVMVPYFGGRLTFQVIGTVPEISENVQSVMVTQKTTFGILEKKLSSDSPEQDIEDTRYAIMQKIWNVENLSKEKFDTLIDNLTKFYNIVSKKPQDKK